MGYRFEGEKLIVAAPNGYAGERPREVSSGAGETGNPLWLLERTIPIKEEPAADFGPARIAQMKRARLRCGGNLLHLLFAKWRYYDDKKSYPPPAITDGAGKPLLSWRVALLPYLGEKELYNQFRLDEPWDSAHNKKLLPKMPKVYASVGDPPKTAHGTFYQVFVGEGCLFEKEKLVTVDDVLDGTVHTIAIVTAADAVPWTKPADLEYAADKPLPNFIGGMLDDGLISFATGGGLQISVNVFDAEKEKIFRAGITRSGGEISELERLRP
jgi:hypothetical protein